ncbi:MAG: YigZ family protein, partial [bacterium]
TILKATADEIKVKGSRFIATVASAPQKEAAENFIAEIRKIYHDATHNCFAYRVNSSVFRFSDDGEPSGTAGRPILNIIEKYQLHHVVLLVTRYFGGTKLGTGGLIRAYTRAAETVVQKAEIIIQYHFVEILVEYPFEFIQKVQHLVQKYKGHIFEGASDRAMISRIEMTPSRQGSFLAELNDVTRGQAKLSNP